VSGRSRAAFHAQRERAHRTSSDPVDPGGADDDARPPHAARRRLTIDCWATSHVFRPGHRIRVEISSSNFPRFDRNLNTGEDQATGARWQVARQTIRHDGAAPSHIMLPVIPR